MLGLVSTLYAVCGMVFALSYLPQLRAVWRSANGAPDVSLGTWGLWCGTSTVSVLYAHVVSHDLAFSLVSLGNALGCWAVTGLTLWRRHRGRLGALSVSTGWMGLVQGTWSVGYFQKSRSR